MKLTTLFFLLLIPYSAYSYNFVGHMVIAEAAYQMLSDEEQEQLDKYAETLKNEGNLITTFGQFKGISQFARSVYLPSTMADESVSNIFTAFNAEVPEALQSQAAETTGRWHYIDLPYNAGTCGNTFVNDVNLETAFGSLKQAYEEVNDETSKALSLVYMANLVGDAHQVLNTASTNTGEEGTCEKDRGGMGFCIVKRDVDAPCPNGKNLNRFWENGAYAVDDIKQFRRYVGKVQKAARDLDANAMSMSVKDWTMETHQHAAFVYDTPKDEWPSRQYEAEAEDLTIALMARAAIRLKILIEQLDG